jgi:hypothetical protein
VLYVNEDSSPSTHRWIYTPTARTTKLSSRLQVMPPQISRREIARKVVPQLFTLLDGRTGVDAQQVILVKRVPYIGQAAVIHYRRQWVDTLRNENTTK